MRTIPQTKLVKYILMAGIAVLCMCLVFDNTNPKGYKLKTYNGADYHVYALDNMHDSVVFGWKDSTGKKFGTLSKFNVFLGDLARMVTNGGMFHPHGTPVGLYIENNKELIGIDTINGKGNFYLKPNGIFGIGSNGYWVGNTERYLAEKPNLSNATQSGPMLIVNNKIHEAFGITSKNLNIRSGVGIDSLGQIYFVLSEKKVNFYDFASFFKEDLNCINALYLDGAISKMQCKEAGLKGDGQFGCMLAVLKKKQ